MNWQLVCAIAGLGGLGVALAAPSDIGAIAGVILGCLLLLSAAGGILWAMASDDDRKDMGLGGDDD